jgi:hypothetical protein
MGKEPLLSSVSLLSLSAMSGCGGGRGPHLVIDLHNIQGPREQKEVVDDEACAPLHYRFTTSPTPMPLPTAPETTNALGS